MNREAGRKLQVPDKRLFWAAYEQAGKGVNATEWGLAHPTSTSATGKGRCSMAQGQVGGECHRAWAGTQMPVATLHTFSQVREGCCGLGKPGVRAQAGNVQCKVWAQGTRCGQAHAMEYEVRQETCLDPGVYG